MTDLSEMEWVNRLSGVALLMGRQVEQHHRMLDLPWPPPDGFMYYRTVAPNGTPLFEIAEWAGGRVLLALSFPATLVGELLDIAGPHILAGKVRLRRS